MCLTEKFCCTLKGISLEEKAWSCSFQGKPPWRCPVGIWIYLRTSTYLETQPFGFVRNFRFLLQLGNIIHILIRYLVDTNLKISLQQNLLTLLSRRLRHITCKMPETKNTCCNKGYTLILTLVLFQPAQREAMICARNRVLCCVDICREKSPPLCSTIDRPPWFCLKCSEMQL